MTIYVCDRCERAVAEKTDLIQIDMTFYTWQSKDEYWRYLDKWKPKDRKVELCHKCHEDFLNRLSAFMKERNKHYGKIKSDTGHGD